MGSKGETPPDPVAVQPSGCRGDLRKTESLVESVRGSETYGGKRCRPKSFLHDPFDRSLHQRPTDSPSVELGLDDQVLDIGTVRTVHFDEASAEDPVLSVP